MIRRRTAKLPVRKAWALIFISLLVQVGLYFGFNAISVPALTPADQARAATPTQDTLSFYHMDFETTNPPDIFSQNLSRWLLHSTADNWFRSVLLALAILLIMVIVMALSSAIIPRN
jgi:hypothetical protein